MNRLIKKTMPLAAVSLAAGLFIYSVQSFPAEAHTQKDLPSQVHSKKASLPLGPSNLEEKRVTEGIAPGVTFTKITRGEPSAKDVYTVEAAFVDTEQEARNVVRKLKNDGFEDSKVVGAKRAMDDQTKGSLGFSVRTGSFPAEKEAKALQERLSEKGYSGLRVVYTGEDGQMTTGPWVVNILEVHRNQFRGKVIPSLAQDQVQGKETLTSMTSRHEAFAGLNGGYFVVNERDGTPGDPAGITVINGQLVSEAINSRSSLILSSAGKKADIASVSTSMFVQSTDGAVREIDGVNRKPGLIRNCGGTGGDSTTEAPKHDFTCQDESELIHYTPAFGESTETVDGFEVVLNQKGEVVETRNHPGGKIPGKGSVLAGTGEAGQWLLSHAKQGMKLHIQNKIMANGKPMNMKTAMSMINGGPRLLKNGKISINAVEEGFHWEEKPDFYYRFGERRNPRTLAGIKENGNLLFVTIDGRAPGWSVGASFEESARIMKSLGAVEAINLDGGGSTSMTIGQALVTRPSDQSGERPIADGILLMNE
ncbi:phosphodiester glycosidase family protein [Mesobacillus foraminis]|uniref:Sporulation related protein n=1 Tax=Mesobacillus foraminis TaxID=279826 RepID=A0A4R2BF35_9BACI|nr:phosphodiester glycosidase family protein [Mesobacillus foraminis]TCN25065.1 sporulation related protein [Mesobacillus foraminis]